MFAAERRASRRYQSTAAALGTQQQRCHSTVLSSKLCSAANASIVTLTAVVGSQTQNCYSLS